MIINMFLNTVHKTLCVQNRTVLKCLWVTPINKVDNRIPIFEKCFSSTLETLLRDRKKENAKHKITSLRLFIFQKARIFLLTNKGYKISTSLEEIDWHKYDHPEVARNIKSTDLPHSLPEDLLRLFKIFSVYAVKTNMHSSNNNYREFIYLLTNKCMIYTTNDLFELLKFLKLWPDIEKMQKPHSYVHKLLEKIDYELNKRSRNWDIGQTLVFCDAICAIFTFHSNFVANSLRKLTEDPSSLSYKNIVQIMYYLFLYDIPKMHLRQLEPYIEDYFDKFTIEEMGIICTGLFKSQVDISSPTLLGKIMQKIIDNVDTLSNQTMMQTFKEIRYSFIRKPNCVEKCMELMEAIVPRVKDMTETTLTQLTHLAADSSICNPRLLTAILEKCTESLRNMRLKDIERILFFMATFNIPSSAPLYNLIIKELESFHRIQETKQFPRTLGFALRHLVLVNIYPLQLISTVMSREHMNLAYGDNPSNLGIEYLILDQSIEIEVPEYRGPRLEKGVCNILSKIHDSSKVLSISESMKKDVIENLNNVFNSKNAACLERILPHFSQTDIILCLDKDNNVIPTQQILKNIKSHIKRVPEEFENKTWIAIICTNRNMLFGETNKFTGNFLGKIRQLEKVGYVPIIITHKEWKILYSNLQKCEYLDKKISEVTKLQKYKDLLVCSH